MHRYSYVDSVFPFEVTRQEKLIKYFWKSLAVDGLFQGIKEN
jgi:hypothetical protein